MTIPTIPLWLVAGIAAIWAGLLLWQLFGRRALTRSRDAGRLARLTTSGEQTPEVRHGLAEELAQAGLGASRRAPSPRCAWSASCWAAWSPPALGQLVIVAVAGMMVAGYQVMRRMVEGVT